VRTHQWAGATAPRFPVLHGRISADGTATLDGRTVDTHTGNTDTGTVTGTTDSANMERALVADAVTVAGLYGRRIRVHLTDPTGKARRLVVHPHGPVYPDNTRRTRRGAGDA